MVEGKMVSPTVYLMNISEIKGDKNTRFEIFAVVVEYFMALSQSM